MLILTIVISLFLVISFFLPDELKVEESIVINKSAYVPFDYVSDLRKWEEWSPLFLLDNDMKPEFSGPNSGIGSSLKWSGSNSDMKSGLIVCSDNIPFKNIEQILTINGNEGTLSSFKFEKYEDNTKVIWELSCEFGFFYRWMRFFAKSSLEAFMINGLEKLKVTSESIEDFHLDITLSEIEGMTLISVRDTTSHDDMEGIGRSLSQAYSEIMSFIDINKIPILGPPVSINIEWLERYIFDAGIPVYLIRIPKMTGRLNLVTIEEGWVVKGTYMGPYDRIAPAYESIHAYITENNLEIRGFSWEEYINDPGITPADSLITNIYFPVN